MAEERSAGSGPAGSEGEVDEAAEHATDGRTRLLGLVVGAVLSTLLGAALVIPAAKAGITPGVSPLVVLFGWMVFGVRLGPRLKGFLAIMQVTGSGGAAVTAGVVFTAPLLQVMHGELGLPVPPIDVPLLVMASLAGALMGFGFVGLATKRFLADPRLPAPEAVACDRLIRTAVANPGKRPRLLPSLVAGLGLGFVVQGLEALRRVGAEVHSFGLRVFAEAGAEPDFKVPVHVSPVYIGIGALLTLPTALLIFSGGLVNSASAAYAATHAMPATTFRWVGGAAMVVAVVFSLGQYVLEGRRAAREAAAGSAPRGSAGDAALLEQSPGVRRALYVSIVAGMLLLLAMMAWMGAAPSTLLVMGAVALVLVSLLSGLGGLLSLQIGSSASPVSGTVFMGMLVLSLTALGIGLSGIEGVAFLVPIVVAACVAICAANDSSQDYKTMQLNGLRVSRSFAGQLVGLLCGAVIVPLTLWVAHDAYTLGSPALPAPQASFFSTVLQSLFLEAEIPWGPVGVGAVLGLAAVGAERLGKRRGLLLSPLAFAVGIYLPAHIGSGIMLGALARFVATWRIASSTHQGILAAAGIITGDALFALLFGIALASGADPDLGGLALPEGAVPTLGWEMGGALLALMLIVVTLNYRTRGAPPERGEG